MSPDLKSRACTFRTRIIMSCHLRNQHVSILIPTIPPIRRFAEKKHTNNSFVTLECVITLSTTGSTFVRDMRSAQGNARCVWVPVKCSSPHLMLSSVAVMKEHSCLAERPGRATIERLEIREVPLFGSLYAPIKRANIFLWLMTMSVGRLQSRRER